MNNRVRSGNLIKSRANSPKCPSPRAFSPRIRGTLSPVPKLSKMPRIISPINRITSKHFIGHSSLPIFLRISQPENQEIIKKIASGKIKTADTSMNELNSFQKFKKKSPISENITGKVKNAGEFIGYVFDNKLNQEQILLRIGKIELSRKDLSCLRPGKLLPINLIDACLSCLKKKNKKMFQKSDSHDRVVIVKTSFAQKVLQSKEKVSIRSKKNLLNFEYLIFPLFIGYWTVLIVNNREKLARYYDPVGIEKNEKQVFLALYEFLKLEISFHQGKSIEKTRWKQLEYEKINENEPYDHIDSAVYVLRQAFKVATGKNIIISPEVLNEYRTKLLVLLFKYGTKIVY